MIYLIRQFTRGESMGLSTKQPYGWRENVGSDSKSNRNRRAIVAGKARLVDRVRGKPDTNEGS